MVPVTRPTTPQGWPGPGSETRPPLGGCQAWSWRCLGRRGGRAAPALLPGPFPAPALRHLRPLDTSPRTRTQGEGSVRAASCSEARAAAKAGGDPGERREEISFRSCVPRATPVLPRTGTLGGAEEPSCRAGWAGHMDVCRGVQRGTDLPWGFMQRNDRLLAQVRTCSLRNVGSVAGAWL